MPDNATTLVALWLSGPAPLIACVFARALGLAWTAPGLGSSGLGWRIKLGLAALVTLTVWPSLAAGSVSADPTTLGKLLPIEAGVGAMLGLTASLVIAGAKAAGELVGVQAGLSPASLLDPEASGDEMNPMGHLYGLIALGVFVAMDGPLRLVGAFVESYQAVPIGGMTLSVETVDLAFAKVGWGLSLALKAAAPAGVALIAAGLAIGLLGRAAPSLSTSLLSLSMPVRALVGSLVVLAGLAGLAATLMTAWGEVL